MSAKPRRDYVGHARRPPDVPVDGLLVHPVTHSALGAVQDQGTSDESRGRRPDAAVARYPEPASHVPSSRSGDVIQQAFVRAAAGYGS